MHSHREITALRNRRPQRNANYRVGFLATQPRQMGVSENRGSKYSTLNSRVLIIRAPNTVPLIFGNSQIKTIERDLFGCRGPGL